MNVRTPTYISVWEILSNCFSGYCFKNNKSGKINDDLYVVHLSWEVEDLTFGDQHIWLLFSPTSSKIITTTLEKFKNIIENLPPLINVDLEDVTLFSIPEIVILSDGELSYNNVTLYLNDENYGHIGWIVGQGRSFNADDNKVVNILLSALSNYLMQFKELENDAFLLEGMKKLLELRDIAKQILKEKK